MSLPLPRTHWVKQTSHSAQCDSGSRGSRNKKTEKPLAPTPRLGWPCPLARIPVADASIEADGCWARCLGHHPNRALAFERLAGMSRFSNCLRAEATGFPATHQTIQGAQDRYQSPCKSPARRGVVSDLRCLYCRGYENTRTKHGDTR